MGLLARVDPPLLDNYPSENATGVSCQYIHTGGYVIPALQLPTCTTTTCILQRLCSGPNAVLAITRTTQQTNFFNVFDVRSEM